MKKIILILTLCIAVSSCNDFVDVVPKGNTIPETVDDLAKMMNLGVMSDKSYTFTEICYNVNYFELHCDDYTITQDPTQSNYMYNNIPTFASHLKWEDPAETTDGNWNGLYKSNYIANYVIKHIDKVDAGRTYDRNETKGDALVHRAMNYFILVNMYGKQYNSATSATDLGVPLVLEPDLSTQFTRATVAEVYNQIMSDLDEAISLLQVKVSEYRHIPSLSAAYSIRARVNLWMANYDAAYQDASKALEMCGELIDYNTCSWAYPPYGAAGGVIGYPTPSAINPEVIYARYKSSTAPALCSDRFLQIIDTENDLRYTLFSYLLNGTMTMFYNYHNHSGINTGEVYLIKAEAALRKSDPDVKDAVKTLDALRINRIKAEAYKPTAITDANELLTEILKERRREIRLTEMAFFDVKRLNLNPSTAREMSRTVLGKEYTLPVGDPRWQLLIPLNVMQLNPKMVQNER